MEMVDICAHAGSPGIRPWVRVGKSSFQIAVFGNLKEVSDPPGSLGIRPWVRVGPIDLLGRRAVRAEPASPFWLGWTEVLAYYVCIRRTARRCRKMPIDCNGCTFHHFDKC